MSGRHARPVALLPIEDVKATREALCAAQTAVSRSVHPAVGTYLGRLLQELIDACDKHRPLAPNGKHGDLHTATCGCEDNPYRDGSDR